MTSISNDSIGRDSQIFKEMSRQKELVNNLEERIVSIEQRIYTTLQLQPPKEKEDISKVKPFFVPLAEELHIMNDRIQLCANTLNELINRCEL